MGARTMTKTKRLGKQPPLYRFCLNPYSDVRYTSCPLCGAKMRQRKLPLLIHVAPMQPVAINKICKYCPACDLLIAHQDEVEDLLVGVFEPRRPDMIGNDYLVIGTLDRPAWKQGMTAPLPLEAMLAHLHDFKRVVTIQPSGGWEPTRPRGKSATT
jgi:hypothetical protein